MADLKPLFTEETVHQKVKAAMICGIRSNCYGFDATNHVVKRRASGPHPLHSCGPVLFVCAMPWTHEEIPPAERASLSL